MLRFYVYVLKLENGQVFYVGKGSGRRMFWHRRVLSRPKTKEYQRGVYRRMRAFLAGRSFTEEKVFESRNEIKTLLREQALIQKYGFENLVNTQTHAFTGRKLKPEVGRLIALRLKDYVRRCRAQYGTGHPPEVAAKISAANKGRVVTPETQAKRTATWKANPANIEKARQQALKLVQMHTGKRHSAEHRAKLSKLRKGRPVTWGVAISKGLIGKASRRNAKSKYRGVTWFGRKKAWQSRIQADGATKSLGQFKLEFDAAWTYDNAFEAAHRLRPNGTPKEHKITRFRLGMHGKLTPVS